VSTLLATALLANGSSGVILYEENPAFPRQLPAVSETQRRAPRSTLRLYSKQAMGPESPGIKLDTGVALAVTCPAKGRWMCMKPEG